MRRILLGLCATVVLSGCPGHKHQPGETSTTQTVGPAGGTVSTADGASLEIPPDAVDSDVDVTITETQDPAPSGSGAVSTLYRFEPEGLVFAHPVTLTLPLPSGVTSGVSVYWSKSSGPGYDEIGGTVGSGSISTEIVHFSTGFVGTATGTRTVSGSQVATWKKMDGTITNVPDDLASIAVEALVLDSAGNFTSHPATGASNGTFTISGIPDGEYYLHLGPSYFVTSDPALDLGYVRLGRPDAAAASTASTFTFDVTGMDAWAPGDQLEMYSPNVDSWWFDLEFGTTPTSGQIALSSYPVTETQGFYFNYPTPARLIEGSKGDDFVLAQLSSRTTTEGVTYEAMSRMFTPSSFDQVDGGNTPLAGAFTDVTASHSLTIDMRPPAWEALKPAFSTSAFLPAYPNGPTGPLFYVLGQPTGLSDGPFSSTADFLTVITTAGTPNFTASNMGYGVPLTGSWGTIGLATYTAGVPVLAPTATNPATIFAYAYSFDDVSTFSSSPIQPRISPVQSPMVATLDLRTPHSGFGTTPTISWAAPATGTATRYAVQVSELSNSGGNTVRTPVANFHTMSTSVKIPSGVLIPGHPYAFKIQAESVSIATSAPLRLAMPYADADFVSAVQTP